MDNKNKIFIVAISASLVVLMMTFFGSYFQAAISGVCIFVSDQNTEPQNTGGGGISYYPATLTPVTEPKTTPSAENPPQEPNNGQNPSNLKPTAQNNIPKSLLPLAVADLAQKIPQFADILSRLNVKNHDDVANLGGYNIFLPGLKSITGGQFSKLTKDQKNKIPSDKVFVLLGNGNIDALTKLDVANNAEIPEKINVLVKNEMTLIVKPSLPAKKLDGYVLFESPNSDGNNVVLPQNFSVLNFTYKDENNDGVYTANINAPSVEGQYKIITSVNYADEKVPKKDLQITTLVDPDGYIYEKVGDKELRINNASVSLFKLNDKNEYELWNAKDYGQENPQTTNITGNYSFLVPEGTYYLSVSAPGYFDYKSDILSVSEGKEVRANIALKKQISVYSFVNWQDISIAVLFLLLGYNFYRDRKGHKAVKKKK